MRLPAHTWPEPPTFRPEEQGENKLLLQALQTEIFLFCSRTSSHKLSSPRFPSTRRFLQWSLTPEIKLENRFNRLTSTAYGNHWRLKPCLSLDGKLQASWKSVFHQFDISFIKKHKIWHFAYVGIGTSKKLCRFPSHMLNCEVFEGNKKRNQ